MGKLTNNSKTTFAVINGKMVKPGESLTIDFLSIPKFFITNPKFEVLDDAGKRALISKQVIKSTVIKVEVPKSKKAEKEEDSLLEKPKTKEHNSEDGIK